MYQGQHVNPVTGCRYSNIDRIYQLPRPQPAGNLVLVHLENAIRRGQTYYEWIAFFFDANAYADDLKLNATEEVCIQFAHAMCTTIIECTPVHLKYP
jgi:hypothetical protein